MTVVCMTFYSRLLLSSSLFFTLSQQKHNENREKLANFPSPFCVRSQSYVHRLPMLTGARYLSLDLGKLTFFF